MKPFVFERRGRKRKPRQELELVWDVKVVAQTMPHRRAVHPLMRHDARAECQLGVLAINCWITEPQYRAGVLLRECVARFHAVCGIPKHDRGAMPLDGLRSGGGRETSDAVAKRNKKAHADVYAELIKRVGVRGAQIVTHVAVYDQKAESIERLRAGLNALVSFYHLYATKSA